MSKGFTMGNPAYNASRGSGSIMGRGSNSKSPWGPVYTRRPVDPDEERELELQREMFAYFHDPENN